MRAPKAITNVMRKAKLLLAALLLLGTQAIAPVSAFIPKASAAPICVADTAGANDVPNQKDLTKLCVDYANVPTTVSTTWNWDELGTSGNNTMDACNLFDTDNDGNVNYAVCVTTKDTPATFLALTTYSCGDTKIDRCTSTSSVVSNGTTSCTVSQQNNDPFPSGTSSPADTQGACTIQLSTVGGASAKLLDVCSYPSAQPNSAPSDCVIARNDFGKVELIKQIDPETDPGLFNLTINGPESNDTFTVNNVGDGGTTGEKVIKKGSVTVSESAGTNTILSNYSTAVVCKDLNGTGSIVGQGSPTGSTTRQLSFTLVEDADVVCTITNTRKTGTITLIKNVVKDNGGTATANDFGLSIGGQSVTSDQTLTLNEGSYAINEVGLTGYSFVSITGTGCPTQLGGNVNLTNGQNITCTITNNDQPGTLIVKKVVTNNNGGTKGAADFSFKVNNGTAVAFEADGQNDLTVNAGTYSVVEPAFAGYAATYDNCTNVVVPNGGTATCTITNDDVSPTLTVIKHVINDNGGTLGASAFTMSVTGTNVSNSSFAGAENPGVTVNLDAGNYSVGETGPSGYAASYSADCTGTIAIGQSKTCTITNDDIAPLLTLIKYVVNDNGGLLQVSDFVLKIDNNTVISGLPNVLSAGSHTASEVNKPGYTAGTWGGACAADGTITLAIGDNKTCTITNNDNAPTLKLVKKVVNQYGQPESATAWTLAATPAANDKGAVVVSGNGGFGPVNVFANIEYSLSESTGPSGYITGSWSCDGGTLVSNKLTLALDQDVTCEITNTAQAPSLTVIKRVVNDNGGTKTVDDFSLTINGDSLDFGAGVEDGTDTLAYTATPTINSDTEYTLAEADTDGYTEGSWSCVNGSDQPVGKGGDLTAIVEAAEGVSITCTITNNDDPGKLIVKKTLVKDNGGNESEADFKFSVNGGQAVNFEADGQNDITVDADTYSVVEQAYDGYTTTYKNCENVTVANGKTETCVITNDDVAPTITLIKSVIKDNGGTAGENDFGLTIDGTDTDSGDTKSVKANTAVALDEAGLYGYEFVSITGDDKCPTVLGGTVMLDEGENITCTITNDDIAPTLTIKKKIKTVNQTEQEFSFTSDFDGFSLVGGASMVLTDENTQAGEYTVTEEATEGWKLNKIVCWGADSYEATDGSVTVTLKVGNNATCKFINEELSTILGSKFEDVNHDGEWSDNEPGLEGWNIVLAELCEDEGEDWIVCENSEQTVVTNEDGNYRFKNLESGYYVVCEEQRDGWTQTYPWWTEDGCHYIELGGEGDKEYGNFGNFELGRVEGVKFNDVNGNGKRDQGEPTLKNWEITLTKKCKVEVIDFRTDDEVTLPEEECEDEVQTTPTDANGAYSFGELEPGGYTVCETQQANWTQTFPTENNGCHKFTINESGQVVTADFGNKAKPQVLGELVNTGSKTDGLWLGLSILCALGALHLATRRKSYSN